MSGNMMSLALFMFPGYHFGAWRLPEAIPGIDLGIDHYIRAAQLAEEGRMDAIFFEDQAAIPRSNNILAGDKFAAASPRGIHFDPMVLLPALAMVTRHLGVAGTATTSFNDPYSVARRFASIDFISKGRAAWNMVTSFNENEAQNFGLDALADHATRYERAGEFVDVVTGLWESWEKGAITRDKESGVYFDVEKMHFLQHKGKYFNVRGPLTMDRSPQVRPVILQAGASDPGRALAARTADVVFTLQTNVEEARAFRADVRARAEAFGRDPDMVKILPGITPFVGRTDQEAQESRERMRDLIPEDLALGYLMQHAGTDLRQYDLNGPMPDLPESNAGKTHQSMILNYARKHGLSILQTARHFGQGNHMPVVGSPVTIADTLQHWKESGACDGFLVVPPYFPGGIEDFVRQVIPELQRRGAFRKEYSGPHLRDHLGVTRYA
ncbi:LLM class flavin-dependent oxidoreductase [Pseudogemmobacter sonorensis]|uniref:LLM class flavin-dependent oxidoreductase n=1 Tax=Pseudogemmobacter sonorensis TaxID=2989681 RepID=UPI0036A4B8A4